MTLNLSTQSFLIIIFFHYEIYKSLLQYRSGFIDS